METNQKCGDGLTGTQKETTLRALIQRTGYQVYQENGQRRYGGPPPGWEGPPPERGSEIFVGKLPRDLFEDELVPLCEKFGKIYEIRMMMDFNGNNRGYAFVTFSTKQEAKNAMKQLNNYEIRNGRLLGVCASVDNCRLFVGGIPKTKKREEILAEMKKVTDGVVDVIVYPSAADKTKNRGFAFVEYESHRAAAMARRKLLPASSRLLLAHFKPCCIGAETRKGGGMCCRGVLATAIRRKEQPLPSARGRSHRCRPPGRGGMAAVCQGQRGSLPATRT